MECWQGQQHAVFVEAGAAAIFSVKFPLQNSCSWGGQQHRGTGGYPEHRGPTEEMLCLHLQCPWHAGGWRVALKSGRREGDTDSHLLNISFSLLFFFPWYLLLKVVCDVMLSLEKASAPSQQGNPCTPHLCFQEEDLPSYLAFSVTTLPPLAPRPHLKPSLSPAQPRRVSSPCEQGRGVQEPPGFGGKPCLSQHRSGGFDVREK